MEVPQHRSNGSRGTGVEDRGLSAAAVNAPKGSGEHEDEDEPLETGVLREVLHRQRATPPDQSIRDAKGGPRQRSSQEEDVSQCPVPIRRGRSLDCGAETVSATPAAIRTGSPTSPPPTRRLEASALRRPRVAGGGVLFNEFRGRKEQVEDGTEAAQHFPRL